MRTALAITSVALLAGPAVGANAPSLAAPSPPESVVATYRAGNITATELTSWKRQHQRAAAANDTRLENLREIALTKFLALEAEQSRLPEVSRVRRLVSDRRESALVGRLRKELEAKARASQAEVQQLIDEAPATARRRPRRVGLRNLFKRWRSEEPDDRARLRRRMETLRRKLLGGADFRVLARATSDSQTRFRGGTIGMVSAGELQPAIDAVAMHMAKGEISPVLETPQGLTVLQCYGISPGRDIPPDELRANAERVARKRESIRQWQALESSLRPQVSIDMAKIVDPNTSPATPIASDGVGTQITRAELVTMLAAKQPSRSLESMPPAEVTAIVEDSIQRQRIAAEAVRRGGELDRVQLERLDWLQLDLLADAALTARVELRLRPATESEILDHYQAHRGAYKVPGRLRLHTIVRRAERANLQADLRQFEHTRSDVLTGGTSFASAAARLSSPANAALGSNPREWKETQIRALGPTVAKEVLGLEPGEMTEVIPQQEDMGRRYSLWLVKLLERTEERPASFDEAQDEVKRDLRALRADQLRERIREELLRELLTNLVETTSPRNQSTRPADQPGPGPGRQR